MVLVFMLNCTMLDVFSGSFFLFIMIFIEPDNLSGWVFDIIFIVRIFYNFKLQFSLLYLETLVCVIRRIFNTQRQLDHLRRILGSNS